MPISPELLNRLLALSKEDRRRVLDNFYGGETEPAVFKSGGNLDGDEKNKNKTGNWFTRATLNAAMADAPAVMQASGWNYDNNGNLVQGDPNSDGAQRLASTLAEIASIPLTDVVLGTAGAAIAGTKAYKSFKLARELNKALKSGALEGKGTVLKEAPVVRSVEFADDVLDGAKTVTGYDMDLHNLRGRYNKFAEFYGYDTIPSDMSDEAAEQLIKKNLERHNTFYRGVGMPVAGPDKAELLKALGPDYTEDEALRYIVEHGRGSDTYLAPDGRAAMYGDGKHVGEVVRKYTLGESPSTWLQDADFVYDATPATGSAPVGKVNYPWASYYENLTVPGEVRMNTGDYVFKRWLPTNEVEVLGNTYYEVPQDAFQGSLNKYVRTEDVYNDGQFYRAYEKPKFSFGGSLLKPYNQFDKGGSKGKGDYSYEDDPDFIGPPRPQSLRVPDNEGGYSSRQATRERKNNRYDPTLGFRFPDGLLNLLVTNNSHGEENEYWRAYLGLKNKVPPMDIAAKTEWDDEIEKSKMEAGTPLSEFYGTTPAMDQMIQVVADTLNNGKILRNYEEYSARYPHLAPKSVFQSMYEQGKNVLNNPGKWIQVGEVPGNPQHYLFEEINSSTNEHSPLGMLAKYGMKWEPSDSALYVQDTYDFPRFYSAMGFVPKRPKEMKIRGKVAFDPTKGSVLLRDGEIHRDQVAAPIATKRTKH